MDKDYVFNDYIFLKIYANLNLLKYISNTLTVILQF